jgi:uncharacterized protein (TIGR02679 family)
LSKNVDSLHDPALDRLWQTVSERLQRNGLRPTGVITLERLTRDERHALAGLLGRPLTADRVRIKLDDLDRVLRDTDAAAGLVDAADRRHGPLIDRKGRREEKLRRKVALWEAVREELAAYGFASADWVEDWLERARPLVARLDPQRAHAVLRTAVRCLASVPLNANAVGSPGLVGRTDLASRIGGDSHALDDGRTLGSLVLRGIAAKLREDLPVDAAGRRELWTRAGVQSDEVSTTVLTFGLTPAGNSPIADAIRARTNAGCEAHLTLRDLRRLDGLVSAGTHIWVCENPRVLEAVMDVGSTATIICTMGNPATVASLLLRRLVDDGGKLRYRGDFDWPGIAMANRVISVYGARPWRMNVADYEHALAAAGDLLTELPHLDGPVVEAVWDVTLTETMASRGRVVHEELMLETLVNDLASPPDLDMPGVAPLRDP